MLEFTGEFLVGRGLAPAAFCFHFDPFIGNKDSSSLREK
jgi:hypothetical protein